MSTFDASSLGSLSALNLSEPEADLHRDLISRLFRDFQTASPYGEAVATTLGRGGRGGGLQSVYPTAGPANVPPVHPSVESLSQPASVSAVESPSYAFGEPHVNDHVLRGRHAADASLDVRPHASVAEAPVGITEEERYRPQDFYFLPREASVPENGFHGVSSRSGSSLPSFDVEAVRRDFPALHQNVNGRPLVWLDNAATTHKPQSVIDATSHYYARDNSNIHRAAHTLAARSTDAFEAGREKVRRFIGAADAKEIVFVRGTTEAINLVAQSYGRANIGAGDEIIISTIEHHANIVPWQLLAQQTGAVLRVAPVNDRGELILEQFAALLGSRTKIVSITQVANSLGTVNPIQEIIALSHAYGVPVLVDAALAGQRATPRCGLPRLLRA